MTAASKDSDIVSCRRFRFSTTRRVRPDRRTALVAVDEFLRMCVLGRAGGGDSLAQTTLRGSPSRNELASRSVEPLRELATNPHPPLAQDVGGNGTGHDTGVQCRIRWN